MDHDYVRMDFLQYIILYCECISLYKYKACDQFKMKIMATKKNQTIDSLILNLGYINIYFFQF